MEHIGFAFFDDGYAGSWADALRFPHNIAILDDASRQVAEADDIEKAPVTLLPHGAPGGGSNGTHAFDAAPGSVPFHHASGVARGH